MNYVGQVVKHRLSHREYTIAEIRDGRLVFKGYEGQNHYLPSDFIPVTTRPSVTPRVLVDLRTAVDAATIAGYTVNITVTKNVAVPVKF